MHTQLVESDEQMDMIKQKLGDDLATLEREHRDRMAILTEKEKVHKVLLTCWWPCTMSC
jgi:hypothetical protein